jgi:DNA polymerase-2
MRGFILQPTYRIESGRPVVCLYGRLEDGRPFLIRDGSGVPHFFVRSADTERAAALGAARIAPTDLVTMDGEALSRVEVAIPSEAPPVRDRLVAAGIPAYEADVRFAMRFLIDRGLKGAIRIDGDAVEGPGGLRVYESPRLERDEWAPALRLLSLDIETDPRGKQVFSVALHGCGLARVIYVDPEPGRGARAVAHPTAPQSAAPAGSKIPGADGGRADAGTTARIDARSPAPVVARSSGAMASGAEGVVSHGSTDAATVAFDTIAVASEGDLIDALCREVAAADPDVLTGWNVVDFDLRVLDAAARRTGRRLRLGRSDEGLRLRLEEGMWRSSRAELVGRIVMDGIDLLRGAFVKLPDYRLETAGRTLLGRGKLLAGGDRGHEIERLYHEDLPRFLEYNFNDALLVTEILDTTGVVSLSVRRSLLTGMPPDRVSASIASFDSLYLHELRRRGVVAPSVGGAEVVEATAGGAVLEPVTGLHENVLVYDFRSLYPSLIRTYNIDPLGLIRGGAAGEDPIRAPNGALFRREPGILPAVLDRLFAERAAAKARGDAVASQAVKILMNSCYGVLATPACRFYSSAVANAITHFGQATLMWAKGRAEEKGFRILYGDTDSLFIAAGTPDSAAAERRGKELLALLNLELTDHVRESHGVRSHLELEFQCLYRKLFLPPVRHGTAGARKRYAGLVMEKGVETIHYTGMEMVRRDWTKLSKIFQRGLFERVFREEDPAEFVRGFIGELKAGAHDGHLVYRKALRKRIEEYTTTTPPHVKAAKIIAARPGQIIDYVITLAGPEPASNRTGAFDYGHYIEKQLRPIAESLLAHLGLDFDEVAGIDTGGGRQMGLFS